MELDMEPAKMIERILDPHHPLCRTEVFPGIGIYEKKDGRERPETSGSDSTTLVNLVCRVCRDRSQSPK